MTPTPWVLLLLALAAANPAQAAEGWQSADPLRFSVTTPPPALSSTPRGDPLLFQVGAGVGAALLATPASLYLGSALGTLSSNLVLAVLPSLLTFLLLPPLAVVAAEWLVLRHFAPGSERFSPALWVTTGAQVLVVIGAVLLAADVQSFPDVAVLSLVEAIVLPAATTLLMRPQQIDPLSPPEGKLLEARRPLAPPRASLELPAMISFPLVRGTL